MKLLLDQGLARTTSARLRELGVDTLHVGDEGMATASDPAIIEFARRTGRVVVTLDADFHSLLALSHASSPSVIRLRVERIRAEEMTHLILSVITACGPDLERGAMVTADLQRARLRRLPLV